MKKCQVPLDTSTTNPASPTSTPEVLRNSEKSNLDTLNISLPLETSREEERQEKQEEEEEEEDKSNESLTDTDSDHEEEYVERAAYLARLGPRGTLALMRLKKLGY